MKVKVYPNELAAQLDAADFQVQLINNQDEESPKAFIKGARRLPQAKEWYTEAYDRRNWHTVVKSHTNHTASGWSDEPYPVILIPIA